MIISCVPGWLLPADAPDEPPTTLPTLPLTSGHVVTEDAVDHEPELVRYFAQPSPLA